MPFRMLRPRLRLRSLLVLVALVALSLWAGSWIWSPLNRFSAQLRASEPDYVRREAAMGLGYGVPPWEVERAISVLIRTLEDPSPRVRESAGAGLAGHGADARAAIPHLLKRVNDPDRGARASIIGALGFIAKPGDSSNAEVVPALVLALADPDIDVRLMAADGLVKLGEAASIAPVLIDAKAEPGYQTRATLILGRMGSKSQILIPGLSSALSDPAPRRREAALALLIDYGSPEVVKSSLRRALMDKDETIRQWAISAMERLGLSASPVPE
jgi:HEAT repeat protein